MAELLKGAPAAKALTEELQGRVAKLKEKGVDPCLAILRVGERSDDLSYEKGAMKRCEKAGIAVKNVVLPQEVGEDELIGAIEDLNRDGQVHGVLMFKPLPKHLDEEKICETLSSVKDVDGITEGSRAAVFAGTGRGYAPCTAQAVMEILKHYQIPLKGKRAVVVGRSLVIGKPVSMLLLGEHATVTICHSRTENLPEVCREADVLVVAIGKAQMVGADYVREGQVVIDVGIHVDEDGNMCGDTRFAEVEPVVSAITPVPGGVGSVTTAILAAHVVDAAEKTL